ncbi:MAG: signal peptidase I [Microbacteriaceae bacterium]
MSGKRSALKERGVFHYLGVGLSAGLFGLVVLLAAVVVVVPLVTGSTPMTVLTSSMVPTYPPGTLVIVRPLDAADIRIGDAITYQLESGKPDVVTHRVISISNTSNGETLFVTQGDNNPSPDGKPVQAVQVRGKVWYSVPWIGYVNSIINGDNRVWIVPAIAGGLFVYAGYMIASALHAAARKRKRARPETGNVVSRDVAGGNNGTPTDLG